MPGDGTPATTTITTSLSIPVPVPRGINIHQGNVIENFNLFEASWKNYAVACELESKSSEVRVAILLSIIGEDCFKIYQNLPLTEEEKKSTDSILKALKKHFQPQVNVIYERFLFNSAKQEIGETTEAFICRLRQLVKTCEYTATDTNNFIRDRLVVGINDNALRKKLLMEKDLTLENAIQICTISELAKEQIKNINNTETVNETNLVQKVSNKVHKKNNYRTSSVTDCNTNKENKCKYCGKTHAFVKEKCPAYGKKCRQCSQLGHFKIMCRKLNNRKSTRKLNRSNGNINYTEYTENESDNEPESVSDENLLQIEQVDTVTKQNSKCVMVEVEFIVGKRAKVLPCVLDTGASCNIISRADFCRLVNKNVVECQPTKTKLRCFGGQIVEPIGCHAITLKTNGEKRTFDFQIVDMECKPLLSADTCEKLKFIEFKNVYSICSELTTNSILNRYKDVFEGEGKLSGQLHLDVDPSVIPVQQQPRRIPVALRDELKLKLDELEKKEIIRKVDEPSEWISNIVLVKRNKKLRICLDPTDLNKALRREKHQMPTIDEILPQLTKAKVFTTLDAKNGFWQIELDEPSSLLTTFWTPQGRYCWKRMPFGISPAPEIYQKKQQEIVQGLKGVEVIADDILVYGQGDTKEQALRDHNENLTALLQRLREKNLKLNSKKSRICRSEVPFYGHLLTENGLKSDPNKIKSILEMPLPSNKDELQRFIGMCTYLGRFLPRLSEITADLRKILRCEKFSWSNSDEECFNKIKKLITSSPILKYYDKDEEVIIQCDASNIGIGACLLQNGLPVAFASRVLTKTEKNYAVIEKECLAILFACKKFDMYICGKDNIVIETDHKPLQNIFQRNLLKAPKRLQRMLLGLQKYNLEVRYKKGEQMYVADVLSRLVQIRDSPDKCDTENVYCIQDDKVFQELESINFIDYIDISDYRLKRIQEATQKDTHLHRLKQTISEGWPSKRQDLCPELQPFWTYREELSCHNGLIFKGDRIFIPTEMRSEILKRVHYSHQGLEACLRRARDSVFWPGLTADVEQMVKNCETCLTFTTTQRKTPLICTKLPDLPFQRVGMDIFEFEGKNFLITVDYYSDFFEVDELSTISSYQIIKCCEKNFSRHGIPEVVVTDGGRQFISQEFHHFANEWEFNHITSSPHHQQTNGKAEAAVRIIKQLMRKAKRDKTNIWKALLEWRNTSNEIGSSPNQRLFSRRTRSGVPVIRSKLEPELAADVTDKIKQRRQKSKLYYDRGVRNLPELQVGQDVYVNLNNSKDASWVPGVIRDKHSSASYNVNVDGVNYRRNSTYIKPYTASEPENSANTTDASKPTEATVSDKEVHKESQVQTDQMNKTTDKPQPVVEVESRPSRTRRPPDRLTYSKF